MTESEFLAILRQAATDSLDAIGPALVRHGKALVTESGQGSCSLVLLRTADEPVINIEHYGGGPRIRHLRDDGVSLSVTDVRLYQHDLKTPDEAKLASLKLALRSAPEVYLSFGLGRPWQQPGDDRERHYLQLNNIHVANWPDWRLCA